MTQLKETLEPIVSQDNLIFKELDESIYSKQEAQQLRFSSSSNEELDANPSTIDLSNFGLRNPNDIKIFLLSPAGETVTHEIGAELMRERVFEEEQQLQIYEQILLQERKRALIFHWLLGEEEESEKARQEIIQMQQEQTRKSNEPSTPKKTATEPNQATKDTIDGYTKSIAKLQNDHAALTDRSKKLEADRQMITEKYDTYDKGLEDFNAARFEVETDAQIKEQIKTLQKEADETADKMMEHGVTDKEVQRLGNHLNTLSLKIASLEDILATRSSKKNEDPKVFADINGNTKDANGVPVTYKDAAFVLSKGQKVERDENGNYYLLKAGQDLKSMDTQALNQAKEDFQLAKRDIKVVKDVVKDVRHEELDHNSSLIAKNKAEKLMVQNQINLMQAARSNAEQALKATPDVPMQSPGSTITTQNIGLGITPMPNPTQSPKMSSAPTPSPQIFNAAAFVQTISNGPKPTWGSLFSKVQTIQDPSVQKDLDKFLTDEAKKEAKKNMSEDKKNEMDKFSPEALKQKLMGMLRRAPVPEVAMNGFLKHMAKFEEAYKPNVTSEESPVAQREQTPISPFNTTPSA
ncbi:coiled coil protein [Legionella sp. WA2022007384]